MTLLREALEPEGYRVTAPDLNRPSFGKLDFDAIVAEAAKAAATEKPSVAIGSSLGALVALAAAKSGALTAPLVLVAPALGFGRRWIENAAPDLVLDSYLTLIGHGFSMHVRPAPKRLRCVVCGRQV